LFLSQPTDANRFMPYEVLVCLKFGDDGKMIKTEICESLGIKYPIVQAAMGPYVTTKLAAAVSNAGGLGILSHSGTAKLLKERAPEVFEQFSGMRGLVPEELITETGPGSGRVDN
jgi:IMP dehydrogenase/GMP reductase